MQIPHQTYKIDLNNINEPLTRMIESVNDKGVRFVDVELWANSQKVTLPQNCTATAAFVTDGFLINESVDCSISDDLTTVIVPIDNANVESKSGIMLVEIKITENGNILTPPFAFKVRVKKSITEDANVFEKSYGTVSEILKEVAEARGNSKTLKDEIATKADKTEVDTELSSKADKSTTDEIRENLDKLNLGGLIIKDDVIKYDINNWLTEHPEATTTVQDGAITEKKLDFKLLSKLSYVTPQMFGAVGDGNADDTVALQSALDTGRPLFIPAGTYKVTKTLYATDMYIDGDTNAVIVGDCGDNAVLELNTETANLGYISRNSYVKNITINADNSSYGLHYNRTHNLSLKNLKIKNFMKVGVFAGSLAGSLSAEIKSYNIETVAEALVIFNESAISGSVGIRNLSTDSYWKDIIVYNTEIGIEPGGNDIVTCHYWNSLADLVANSTAFVLRDNVSATLTACCSDSSRYAVRLGDYSRATINGLRIIYATKMVGKYCDVGDCVIIDSALKPNSTSEYYKSCTAHITGLEVKRYTQVIDGVTKTLDPKLLSDYLYGRYTIEINYWQNISISSSFIAPTVGNQPLSIYQFGGLANFSNVNGSRNISGTTGLNDCNIFNIGIFSCTTTTLNIPEAVKGMLICLSSGAYNWSQIYITSSSVYTRYSSNGTTWSDWIKINSNS